MRKKTPLLNYLNLLTLFVSATVLFQPNIVLAQTLDPIQEEVFRRRNGIIHNDDQVFATTCAPSTSTQVATGSNNVEVAYNQLQLFGLTSEQAAGVVGNLMGESGVEPTRRQGSGFQTISDPSEIVPGVGFGIAQWTTAGRQEAWINFANTRGEDPLSLTLQLAFLWEELTVSSPDFFGYPELQAAQDVRQATWIFLAYFERPASVVNAGLTGTPTQPTGGSALGALDARTDLANTVIRDFGTGNPETGPSPCGGLVEGDVDFAANPNVQLDGSPSGAHRDSNCTGGFTVGAQALSDYVLERWRPPVTSVGGYSCRPILFDASNPTSIHGLGRALDIMVDGTTTQGLQTGNEIRNFMINNAERLGVQRVIWDRHIWSSDQNGWRDFGDADSSPHTDHLHVEINIEASGNASLI